MISKQSIRNGVTVYCDGNKLTKDELINLTLNWSEKETSLLKKMLKQGGTFRIKGKKFVIFALETIYNSKGEEEQPLEVLDEE
jgi:hypothetical protein